jgi:hypothetical protein
MRFICDALLGLVIHMDYLIMNLKTLPKKILKHKITILGMCEKTNHEQDLIKKKTQNKI